MIARKLSLALAFALALASAPFQGALADFTFTQGSGPTAFSFTATTGGTAICAAASTHCWASVPINAAGAALFVTGNAGLVTGTGGTFPAIQSGTWTVQPGNTANTTAWLVTGAGGTFPVTGTVTANAGTGNFTVVNGGTFATQATLGAETTKVIGTVRNLGNAGAIFDAATGAAVPANGLYVGMSQGGNLTGLTGTSGNLNVQCANCSGSGVSTADQAAFTAGSSLFAGSGGFFQTTATNNPLTTGQQGLFQVTAQRALFSNLRNASGTEVGTSGAPLRTDPTGTTPQPVTQSGSWTFATAANQATEIAALQAIQTNTGLGALVDESAFTEGSTSNIMFGCYFKTSVTNLTTGQSGAVQCTNDRMLYANLGKVGGTAVDVNSGNKSAGTQRNVLATDQLALATWGHGAFGATAPTSGTATGLRAQNAEATAVTNGQQVGAAADLAGKAIMLPFANPENFLDGNITSAMTGTSSTAVTGMGAQAAGVRNYVTTCIASNSHATVGTMMLLQDGSGGTTLGQLPAAPAFGGATVHFNPPIKTTAATGLFAANVTTGANTFLTCTGYKGI